MYNRKAGRETYREDQYRIIIFHPNGKPVKYRKVELDKRGKEDQVKAFCDRKFPGWTAINVYGGLSRQFKRQIRPAK